MALSSNKGFSRLLTVCVYNFPRGQLKQHQLTDLLKTKKQQLNRQLLFKSSRNSSCNLYHSSLKFNLKDASSKKRTSFSAAVSRKGSSPHSVRAFKGKVAALNTELSADKEQCDLYDIDQMHWLARSRFVRIINVLKPIRQVYSTGKPPENRWSLE